MIRFRTYSIIGLLFSSIISFGQATVCVGDDYAGCIGEQVNLDVCGSGTGSSINTPIYTLTNPQSFTLSDDVYTGQINLGFDFNFYGQDYDKIVVSSNGVVSFDMGNASSYSAWTVTSIPSSTSNKQKSIMAVWYDYYPPHGSGAIYYQTIGTAPNRIGVIYYDGLSFYSSSCQTPDLCFTGAILLFEGSNRIETHISNKTTCTSWGGGYGTHGLNLNSSTGIAVPGRNNTIFNLQNDGKAFIPQGGNNYQIDDIPFAMVTTNTNSSIVWADTEGNTYPYGNGELLATITGSPVGYFLSSSTCEVGVGAISDTTWLSGMSTDVTLSTTNDFCGAGVGTVTATPDGVYPPYSYNWTGLGNASTQTVTDVPAGNYTVEVTDGNGCVNVATATVFNAPADYPIVTTDVSCPGGSDGTATVTMDPSLGNVTYQWNDANNQTTSTATGLSAGTYECFVSSDVGCDETVTVVVEEVPAMNIQVTSQTDVTCNNGQDGRAEINVTNGNPPYSYIWSSSTSNEPIVDDLRVGTTTVTVTDSKGCIETEDITLTEPVALSVKSISQDTIICIGDSVRLFAEGDGGSSDYIYNWKVNNEIVAQGSEVYVTPNSPISEYCVIVTEECGSPEATDCVKVNYPPEVDPTLSPDKTGECFPVEVMFDNITDTEEDIILSVWNYGDGDSDTVSAQSSISHEFGEGIFDVELVVFTQRGCRYEKNYTNLIEGYSYPVPEFYMLPDPATVYEPIVEVFSQASNDVISYEWYAEGATPAYSSLSNPTFKYPSEEATYPLLLVVENEKGCIDSLQKEVRIVNDVLIFSPNTFTPDGDGFNDTWKVEISGIDIYNYHLEVFNRWGEKVFESFDPEGEWDGTFNGQYVRDGTYVWKIRAVEYGKDMKYEFEGYITIIR